MKQYRRYLFEWILSLPLAFGCLLLFSQAFGIRKMTVLYCALALLSCTVCVVFRCLRGKDRLLLAGVLLILLGSPALYGLRFGKAGYFYRHRYLWLVPALCVFCSLFALLCRNYRAARILLAAVIVAGLVLLLLTKHKVSKLCVMLLYSVLGLLLADETQLLWRKNGHTEHAMHLVFVAPFLALWLGLSLLLPTANKPYDWHIVKNIWHKIEEFGISLSQKRKGKADDFDALKPGFGWNMEVKSGHVIGDDRDLLLLNPNAVETPVLRLAGQTCDTFSDMIWSSSVEENLHEHEFDLMETRIAFEKTGHFKDYVHYLDLNITYREFSSYCLFTPDKPVTDSDSLKQIGVRQAGRNLLFDKPRGIGSRFSLSCLQLNRRSPEFLDYMKDPAVITKENWDEAVSHERKAIRDLGYEDYTAYKRQMTELYAKPAGLSDTAREFLAAATEGAESDFEKMLLLEQALSGFTYSVRLASLPDNVHDASSFMDYFLETRVGYCMHFATAMVLLAREAGLPARFVQGFCAPVTRYSSTYVTADMAHAWCEIYFENVGWILFDATPGYYGDAYWTNGSGEGSVSGGLPSKLTPVPTKALSPTPTPTLAPLQSDEPEKDGTKTLLWWVGGIILLLLCFTVLVLLSDRLFAARRFRRMNSTDQVRTLYRRNRRLLWYLGFPQREEETLGEYATRLRQSLPPGAVDWISGYEAFLYGAPTDFRPVASLLASGNRALTEEFRSRYPRRYRICKLFNRLIH